MQGHLKQEGYFPHIDGLRAVAVLAVIFYHLNPNWLPGGFTGVDVFFVISGFVVSASVARSSRLEGWKGVLGFYARRMRRIMPALLVCLLATGLLSTFFIPESWLSETSGKTGRMAFVGLSNWVLAGTGNDYFSPRSEFNPYTHTWSLGVEEQFYLLFPLLFLGWEKGGKGRGLSMLLFALATAGSLAFAISRALQGGYEIQSFYQTTTRFWQLGVGVLLFQLLSMRGRLNAADGQPGVWHSLLLGACAAVLGYGLWAARPGHSPWIDGLWPVLGTLGLLALLQRSASGWIGSCLSLRSMVVVGRMSYSLYLWHWPVFVLFRWTVGLGSLLTGTLALLCTALLAWASWRCVEQPARFGRRWRGSDLRLVAGGALVLLLGMGLQKQVERAAKYVSLSTVSRHPLDWYPYSKGLKKEFPDCELVFSRLPVAGGQVQQFERGQCADGKGTTQRLFVAGDSHALAYGEMLRRLVLLDGGQARLYASAGCAFIDLQGRRQADSACDAYVRNTLADVTAHAQAGDVLLLPGLRVPRLVEQYSLFDREQAFFRVNSDASVAQRKADVEAAIAELKPLAERGVRIVLEAPKPVLGAPPFRCSDAFNRHNPICVHGMTVSREQMEALRAPALSSLQQVAQALPGASVWDPLPVLCPGPECLPDDGGKPLFFDGDHLSGHGNRMLLPSFRAHQTTLSR
ncbi:MULTISPECIES: acyltransferase family protein [Stenotrophomonas]|uniref:acyltransferase family protein n=1 Tax=Stenotrophomonas TaxID=40323 RepID=UPI00076FE869|nr:MULTISPECIES: acyltransferase family protein [Stenotrophomonas]AMJ55441.1 acetylase [Stenotrophomonas sp. KCTC 12332]